MTEQIIGGGRISEAAQSLPNTMTDEEREASEREAERREMAFRELFAGDPKVVLMSLLHRVTALEDALAGLDGLESQLTEAREKLDARPETVMPDDERKVSDYRFKVPFLQSERLVNEDLNDADKRLFDEYTKLELSRPLEPSDDARWRLLQAGFFEFRG